MFILYYQYFILFALSVVLINFIVNNILFKNIRNFKLPVDILNSPPLVSVLIPARNEEKNIRRILNSMLKQDYRNLEILVLDDNSTDATGDIVEEFVKKDGRIKLIKGAPLPAGWKGKCFACHQLSKIAKGSYFVFTDADTLHYPNSISGSLAALLKNNLIILSFMPLILVKHSKAPFFSTAIGQFFLFKREAYEKTGGFEFVKDEILEDINISKQVKRCGLKIMIYDGSDSIFCRMFTNLPDVIKGFSRFIYAAFDCNFLMEFIAVSFIELIYLGPFILLPIGIFILDWPAKIIALNIIQMFLIFTIKFILAIRFKERILDVFFTPVSLAFVYLLAINSYRQSKFGKGVDWKDRVYSVHKDKDSDVAEGEHTVF
jgi:chlorobactene glucosyltransferase